VPRQTDKEYSESRERQLDSAMSRLNIHKGNLLCMREAHYGGNISRDIELVLEALHAFRSESAAKVDAVDPSAGTQER
jgi:hypothetical protein